VRLKSVRLNWFRGAASPVELPANGKSLVVYGQNGAGKSSFVDGIEYAINDGRLEHLRHEYSGRHQERAVGCELVFKLLLGAGTNHGSVFPNDNRPGERPFDP